MKLKIVAFFITLLFVAGSGSFSHASTVAQSSGLGNDDAPVVFYDFSSLSCPHCADWHNNILPQIKENYIDTGKARIVFMPMPLNRPALMGEQIARCVPEDQYIQVIDFLFENQKNWAFSGDPKEALLQQAALLGLDREKAIACIEDRDLEESIANSARESAATYQIRSTPTFVFDNGERKLKGTGNYERFSGMIDFLYERHLGELEMKKLKEETSSDTDTSE